MKKTLIDFGFKRDVKLAQRKIEKHKTKINKSDEQRSV